MALNKNEKVGVFLAVVLAFVFLWFTGSWLMSGPENLLTEEEDSNQSESMQNEGLLIEDVTEGTGDVAVSGAVVTVHYTGRLQDGSVFDSSVSRNQPFVFLLGSGQVIKGWDQGLQGMKVGGKRILTISPEMGYGNAQAGSIPPNSTLIFEVDLLKVETPQN